MNEIYMILITCCGGRLDVEAFVKEQIEKTYPDHAYVVVRGKLVLVGC